MNLKMKWNITALFCETHCSRLDIKTKRFTDFPNTNNLYYPTLTDTQRDTSVNGEPSQSTSISLFVSLIVGS